MTFVVTGAAGFIGRHVVAALHARGQPVVGIDRRLWSPLPHEQALVTDLLAQNARVVSALRSAEAVIHLAGRAGVRDTHPDAAALQWRDNVEAGRRVLEMTPLDTPLVVASSSSVYGGTRDPAGARPSAEDDPLRPRGSYARSKLALERCCDERLDAGGHVAVARPFTVAGEGQRPDMAISRWISAADHGRPLEILGDPERRRDVTDVCHVAEALVRLVERSVVGVVNVGTGVSRTLAEIAHAVSVTVRGCPLPLLLLPPGRAEVVATRADTRRCESVLGFVPTTDLATVICRQAAHVRGRAGLVGV